MKRNLINSFFIALLVFCIGLIFSVNLGELLDGGLIDNARAYIIAISVLFLAGIVAASTYLILHSINNKKNL